ncbi:MAG: EthD domain-containing protein [Actinomycetota bacterium]|nr:EthD domain-containing protein [Actinomycetota bacterium]
MLRLTFLIRRRSDLSREEFQTYWRTHHGPLMASFSTDLDVLRYVQCHTTDDDHSRLWGRRGQMEEPYDGVAEVWWASRDAFTAASATDAGRAAGAAMLADEHNFMDLANSNMWASYEYPQVNPSPENLIATEQSSLVKLYFPLRHVPSLDFDDAQKYWRTHHGPIIRRQAAGSGILRYQQVHRDEPELTEALRRPRNVADDPYTGHAEVWLDRDRMGIVTPERKAASRRAYEDESNFIDFTRSTMFLCKEHVFIDKR